MSVTSYLVINGQIISETRNNVESDYIADGLGSTAALMNTSGVITDTFTYWPFGQVRSHVGSIVTPFRFGGTVGYYSNLAGDSLYERARYYKPLLSRWQTVDPVWPVELAYVYVSCNPTTLVDPSGEQQEWGGNCKYQLPYNYDPGYWNWPYNRDRNNCHNYALNDPGGDFRQPGDRSGNMYDNMPGGRPSCNNLLANSIRDGLKPLSPRLLGGCGRGFHKVCLYISGDDFHWWRQDPDGTWSSKPGHTPASNCYIGTNIPITSPDTDAPRHGYNQKCGCLCAANLH
jgi:RHS repeat-associated protein